MHLLVSGSVSHGLPLLQFQPQLHQNGDRDNCAAKRWSWGPCCISCKKPRRIFEVEFSSADQSQLFDVPAWMGCMHTQRNNITDLKILKTKTVSYLELFSGT